MNKVIEMGMEEEFNWKLASNAQLKEECERLENDFTEKQRELGELVSRIDELNNTLVDMSKKYNDIKSILEVREGKK